MCSKFFSFLSDSNKTLPRTETTARKARFMADINRHKEFWFFSLDSLAINKGHCVFRQGFCLLPFKYWPMMFSTQTLIKKNLPPFNQRSGPRECVPRESRWGWRWGKGSVVDFDKASNNDDDYESHEIWTRRRHKSCRKCRRRCVQRE